jgi:hypothetical protein
MCIFAVNDVAQFMVVPATPSAVLLLWSDAAGWVPMGTQSVVILVTPIFVLLVVDYICHGCYVQLHLQAFDMCVDFFIIFWQMEGDLIDEDPWS